MTELSDRISEMYKNIDYITQDVSKKTHCHTCGARIDEDEYDPIDGGQCVMCGSEIKRSE